jgi:hypothetical protein
MSTARRIIESHEPQIRILYYAQDEKVPNSPSRHVTRSWRLPIAQEEVDRLAKLELGDILDLPQEFIQIAGSNGIAIDQISQIQAKNNGVIAVRFLVDGVIRQGEDFGVNRHRSFVAEDADWMTVTQSRQGWGVFEMSHDVYERESGTTAETAKIVLTETDKIVRLIGDTFRVIDVRAELKPAPDAGDKLKHG